MSSILAIDFGTKKVGFAISDETRTLTKKLSVFQYTHKSQLWAQVKTLVRTHAITEILVGLPVDEHGNHTQWTSRVIQFTEQLQKELQLPVHTSNEYYSTKFVKTAQNQVNYRGIQIDSEVARMLLEQYINHTSFTNEGSIPEDNKREAK